MSNNKSLVVVEGPLRPIRRQRPLLVLAPLAIAGLVGLLVFLFFWGKPTVDVGTAAINVGPVIVAEPWNATPLPIQLGPPEAVPKGAWIQIDGLPLVTALSEGHVLRPGSWIVPLSRLPMLKITAPPTQGPMPKVTAPSVAPDPENARLWYAQAKHLWNTRVDFHLQRLGPPKRSGPAFP